MDERLLTLTIEILHDLYTANLSLDSEFETSKEDRITADMILDERLEELSALVNVSADELRRRVLAL